jgi:hypothetical protein
MGRAGRVNPGTPRRPPRPSRPGGDVCCGCLGRGRCEAHSGTSAVDAVYDAGEDEEVVLRGALPWLG